MKTYPNSVATLEGNGYRLVVRGPIEYEESEDGTHANILPECRRYAFRQDERVRWVRCKTADAVAALRELSVTP